MKLDEAFARFDAINAQDPRQDEGQPKELLYGKRMSARLEAYAPDAPESVKLAARAQHLKRWTVPRDEYPKDRVGYLRWRKALYEVHAEEAAKVLREVGYDDETIAEVQMQLRKKGLKTEAKTQLLEDVICLVFLEHYWGEFMAEHDDEKLIGILRKTWAKMSEKAHAEAAKMDLDERSARLLQAALDA